MILLSFNIINHNQNFRNGNEITEIERLNIIQKNISSILRILETNNVLATFFVEISLAEKLQNTIKKIVSKGHEIAFYNQNSTAEEITQVKTLIENFIEKNIRGIRQKEISFQPESLKLLEFSYVSNIENANVLFPFKRLQRSTEVYEIHGLSCIPESISPYSQLPYNDFVFQILPLKYYQSMVFETIKNEDFVLIYLDTRQFTDYKEFNFKIPFYRKWNSGRKMEDKLDEFLGWANENELAFSRMKDYLF